MLTSRLKHAAAGSALLSALLLAGAQVASAEEPGGEFARGKAEYVAACAACHGEAADGNGPIASMFNVRVPDLRKLSAANDGEFPFLKIFHIIDGRTAIRAHGNPMPVFGNRYATEAEEHGSLFGSETLARARVTELVLYLQSLQQ